MTAKQMSHFKSKLMEVSKQLYLENGWKMPKGFISSQERSPANFTLAEWQQAKRSGLRPDDLKTMAQECWAVVGRQGSLCQGDGRTRPVSG
jgi:hypothetical protein